MVSGGSYAAGATTATFSKMEMQLSPFLSAIFGKINLQKTDDDSNEFIDDEEPDINDEELDEDGNDSFWERYQASLEKEKQRKRDDYVPTLEEVKDALSLVNNISDYLFLYVPVYQEAVFLLKKLLLNRVHYTIDGISTTKYLYALINNKQKYFQAMIEEGYKIYKEEINKNPYDDEKQSELMDQFAQNILDYVSEFDHSTKKCVEIHLDKLSGKCRGNVDYKAILNEHDSNHRFPNTDIGDDVYTKQYGEQVKHIVPKSDFSLEFFKNHDLTEQINNCPYRYYSEDECRYETIKLLIVIAVRKTCKYSERLKTDVKTFEQMIKGYSYYLNCIDEMMKLNGLLDESIIKNNNIETAIVGIRDEIIQQLDDEYLSKLEYGKNDYMDKIFYLEDIVNSVEPKGTFKTIADAIIEHIEKKESEDFQKDLDTWDEIESEE